MAILKATYDVTTNWCHGQLGIYEFKALVFKEPSQFGINEGKVSKLMIKNANKDTIEVNYERGWSKKPTARFKYKYERILNFLETADFFKKKSKKAHP